MDLPTFSWYIYIYLHSHTIPILIRKFQGNFDERKNSIQKFWDPKVQFQALQAHQKDHQGPVTESMMAPGRDCVQQWMTKGSSPFEMMRTFRGLNKVGVVLLPHRPEIADVLFCGWDTKKNNRSCCFSNKVGKKTAGMCRKNRASPENLLESWMDANPKIATATLPHIELGWFISSVFAFHFSRTYSNIFSRFG